MLQLSVGNPFETDTLAQVQTVHERTGNKSFKLSMHVSKCWLLCAHASWLADVNHSKVNQFCKDTLFHWTA